MSHILLVKLKIVLNLEESFKSKIIWFCTHPLQWLRYFAVSLQNWKLCETGLADCALKLEEIKARLKSPLPEKLEDLKTHEQLTKVIYASDSDNSELI